MKRCARGIETALGIEMVEIWAEIEIAMEVEATDHDVTGPVEAAVDLIALGDRISGGPSIICFTHVWPCHCRIRLSHAKMGS